MGTSFFVGDFQAEKSFLSSSSKMFNTFLKVKIKIILFVYNNNAI